MALVGLYYLLALNHVTSVPLSLAAGLLILLTVSAWQLRAIVGATEPAMRAIVALASTVPLFLLLFASNYYALARASPANFTTHQLTRTDALYFTITTFSTVGYGDITPTSQTARLLVTAQELLDLLVLGVGIRVFVWAVQLGRKQLQRRTRQRARTTRTRQRRDAVTLLVRLACDPQVMGLQSITRPLAFAGWAVAVIASAFG